MQSRSLSLLVAGLGALAPLAGIVFLGWDWREILLFYWLGNITVGLQVVLSVFRRDSVTDVFSSISPRQFDAIKQSAPALSKLMKPLMIGFFILHYGLFTLGHGFFVYQVVSGAWFDLASSQGAALNYTQIIALWAVATVLQLATWLTTHGRIMTVPAAYGRITVLHLSIVFGLFLITWLQWPAVAAILLVVLSVVAEVVSTFRQKEPLAPVASSTV